jgi:hypothetical protein
MGNGCHWLERRVNHNMLWLLSPLGLDFVHILLCYAFRRKIFFRVVAVLLTPDAGALERESVRGSAWLGVSGLSNFIPSLVFSCCWQHRTRGRICGQLAAKKRSEAVADKLKPLGRQGLP